MTFQSNFLKPNDPDYFPVRYHAVEGSPRRNRMRFLKCSDPICAREEEITDNGRTELPTEVVRKKFRQRGWEVGKDRTRDVCPVCIENVRVARRQSKEAKLKVVYPGPSDELSKVSQEAVGKVQAFKASAAPEPPETMSRDERRIVFAKIEEHWAGENEGYTAPWTDQKIASDLGVPVGWVAEVRSDFFGEVRDNSEIRELLGRATQAAIEASQKVAAGAQLLKEAQSLTNKANTLNGELADLRKSVEGMIAIASRIERSLK